MKTFYICFLALAACATAEEVNVAKIKRGLQDEIAYGNAQFPLGSLINLGQGDTSLQTLPSIPISYEYGQGHGNIASIGNYAGLLAAGVGVAPQPLSSYSFANTFRTPSKPNGYNTGYGLGAYAGEAFIQKQLSSGAASRTAQTFPIQDLRDLVRLGPQDISSHPHSPYSFRRTEFSPSPIPGGYPLQISSYQPRPPLIPSASSGVSVLSPLRPASQPGIAFGSGSLGITQLSNGNYALGSGSIGYAGSLAAAAATPSAQSAAPTQINLGQNYFKGY